MSNLKENRFYVYALIDPRTNLPFYIGKGQGDRCLGHFKQTKNHHTNSKKYNKIQSLKKQGFEIPVEKLYENLDENTAYSLEKELIKKYGRKDIDENGILTNIDAGGHGSSSHTKKSKDLISEKQKIRYAEMPAEKRKRKPHTEATKEKMRNKKLGKKLSEEHKQKLRDASGMRGKNHKEESIEKMRLKRLGFKFKEESVQKMKESHFVFNYEFTSPEGEIFITMDLRGFCERNSVPYHSMKKLIQGTRKNSRSGWKCRKL